MFKKRSQGSDEPVEYSDAAVDSSVEGEEVDDGLPVLQDDEVEGSFESGDEDYDDAEDDEPHERDPLVGWLTLLSILLMLVVVAATIAIVIFLLGMRGAPRTAVERVITSSEAAVQADPSPENFRELAYAYISAGRLDEARSAIRRGRRVKDISDFDLAEADILRLEEKHSAAVQLYSRAATRNTKEFEAEQKALVKRGITAPATRTTYVSINIGKGESLIALGRKKEALAAFKEAVKWEGTNAFALVRMGDMSRELGLKKEAKLAYEEALRFIPDYEEAQEGLKALEGGSTEKGTNGND